MRRNTDTHSHILYQWQYRRILCSLSKLHEAYTQKRNKQSKAKVPQGNTGNTQNLNKLKQAWIVNGLKSFMQFAVHATIPKLGPTAWIYLLRWLSDGTKKSWLQLSSKVEPKSQFLSFLAPAYLVTKSDRNETNIHFSSS